MSCWIYMNYIMLAVIFGAAGIAFILDLVNWTSFADVIVNLLLYIIISGKSNRSHREALSISKVFKGNQNKCFYLLLIFFFNFMIYLCSYEYFKFIRILLCLCSSFIWRFLSCVLLLPIPTITTVALRTSTFEGGCCYSGHEFRCTW